MGMEKDKLEKGKNIERLKTGGKKESLVLHWDNSSKMVMNTYLSQFLSIRNNIKSIIASGEEKKSSLKERIVGAMQIAQIKSIEKLENHMHFLAIIGSVAPFIGLFGTVWGIMNSFQGIAASKNTSLAVVAPGIAEALLATAIGLFAAIPAVFFYNIYNNKINHFADRMHNFSTLITNVLSRELDR